MLSNFRRLTFYHMKTDPRNIWLLFSLSVISDSLWPHGLQKPAFPVLHHLLELAQTHVQSVMPSSHLIRCCPLLLLPPIRPSIRVFSNESTLRMRSPVQKLSWPSATKLGYPAVERAMGCCNIRDKPVQCRRPQFDSWVGKIP